MPEDAVMDNPLPDAEMLANDAGGTEIEAKQTAEEKLGTLIQEVGQLMEMLIAAEVISEGDDAFKALAAIMANTQTALDSLSGEMAAEIDNEPEIVTPAASTTA